MRAQRFVKVVSFDCACIRLQPFWKRSYYDNQCQAENTSTFCFAEGRVLVFLAVVSQERDWAFTHSGSLKLYLPSRKNFISHWGDFVKISWRLIHSYLHLSVNIPKYFPSRVDDSFYQLSSDQQRTEGNSNNNMSEPWVVMVLTHFRFMWI